MYARLPPFPSAARFAEAGVDAMGVVDLSETRTPDDTTTKGPLGCRIHSSIGHFTTNKCSK